MKIDRLRVRRLTGTLEVEGVHWEGRAPQPSDGYRSEGAVPVGGVGTGYVERGVQVDGRHLRLESLFLEITTDAGVGGVAGPISLPAAWLAVRQLSPLLVGSDPFATERTWDLAYRSFVHGRQGDGMLALSAVDCALWDLKGKFLGLPCYRLLGGPTRDAVPAYASMYGFDVTDLGRVRERARWAKEAGFTAQKWFLAYGPSAGAPGMAGNVALVRALREELGDDDLMIDAWGALDPPYALEFVRRIAEYRPRWIEQPVLPEQGRLYAEIRRRTGLPVAGGEHTYTRWGLVQLLDVQAIDVFQPDIYWSGGISEVVKMAALASVRGVPVVPHGTTPLATLHFSLAQPPGGAPVQEHLFKFSPTVQFFSKHRVEPVSGRLLPIDAAGLGMELDEDRIERAIEVDLS
jgi:L-alanine-DL-glutamate epimerase-like enolase superfamily enzyme